MVTDLPERLDEVAPGFDAAYARIAEAMNQALGVRLFAFKRETVLRRVMRRMRLLGLADFESYSDLLAHSPEQAQQLARDMQVPNASLFADPELCATLQMRLMAQPRSERGLQVWVPACGQGEEVFALAMLLSDALTGIEASEEFLIFGTGFDPEALSRARDGVLADDDARQVPEGFRKRFLIAQPEQQAWRVAPALLRRCVFLAHDPLSLPPFSELNLVSARNLLLFLEADSARTALEMFHRSLCRDGMLLVSRTDRMTRHGDLFMRRPLGSGLYARASTERAVPAARLEPVTAPLPYRNAFERSRQAAVLVDDDLRVLAENQEFQELARWRFAGRAQRNLAEILPAEDGERLTLLLRGLELQRYTGLNTWLMAGDGGIAVQFGLCRLSASATLVEAVVSHEPLVGADVQELHAALGLLQEAVLICDEQGQVRSINAAAERLLGCPMEAVVGRPHERIVRLVRANGEAIPSPVWPVLRQGQNLARTSDERYLLAREGRRVSVRYACGPVDSGPGGRGAVLVIEDITEFSLVADELAFRSSCDPLTGLINRDEFERRLGLAIVQARDEGLRHVLCYLDLDQFKIINDTLGHSAGDELLREISGLFRTALRPQDVLARLGGDEFGLLLSDVDEAQGRAMVEALLTAARAYRFTWENAQLSSTVSIGATVLDAHTENTAKALSEADAACFAAKDGGRDRARWVTPGDAEIRHRHGEMSLIATISRALDENAFELHYEDVVSVADPQRVRYRELLIRMRDEKGQMVSPGRFIAAAERYYLMTALDRWVLENALAAVAQLPADGVIYALNISGMSLSDENFMRFAEQALRRLGPRAQSVCIEITETAAITHLAEAVRFMRRLSDLGCRFAMDDFGAGMASFAYLKNLPVDFLKIDGSFVRAMMASHVDRGMVDAINRIGKDMGLKTIAEHVEQVEVLRTLDGMGIDWAQGRAIAPTRPLRELLSAHGAD